MRLATREFMELIKHLYGLARTLKSIQVDTETTQIKLSSVDIELDYNDYNHIEHELHASLKTYEFKYIEPITVYYKGRVKGYIRVSIDGMTFNIYKKIEGYDVSEVKVKKPFSRFW